MISHIEVQQHVIDTAEFVSIRNQGAKNSESAWCHLNEVPDLIERLSALQSQRDPNAVQLTLFDQDEYLDPQLMRWGSPVISRLAEEGAPAGSLSLDLEE